MHRSHVVGCRAGVAVGPRYGDPHDLASGRSGREQGIHAHKHVHQRRRRYRLPDHRAHRRYRI